MATRKLSKSQNIFATNDPRITIASDQGLDLSRYRMDNEDTVARQPRLFLLPSPTDLDATKLIRGNTTMFSSTTRESFKYYKITNNGDLRGLTLSLSLVIPVIG